MHVSINIMENEKKYNKGLHQTCHLQLLSEIGTSVRWSLELIKYIRIKFTTIHEMAFKTLVHPLEEYYSSVRSPYTQSNIHKIEMI